MLEEFCKELTNTYDTNILDNQSEVTQKQFLDISLKNRNNTVNPGKKVLMELICNHYSPSVKKPIADFIGGPKTLSIHWHPVYKKIIYILGEWHANNMDCDIFKKDAVTVPAEDYLYDLMLSTDVFLDIYIELESYKGGEYLSEPYTPGRTDELFKKFRKCLQYNTRSDTSCKLARVHYFDIRDNNIDVTDMEENKITILWIKHKIEYILLNEGDNKTRCVSSLKSLLQKYPKISTLLRELVQDDIKTVCEFMKKQLAEEPYIKKNLDKIKENPELKTEILTFYGNILCKKIEKIKSYIKKDILNILNYNEQSDDVLFKSMDALNALLSRSMTFFADVYLLGRMFKDFDMSEMEKKAYKGAIDQPNRAKNIIIYCGAFHAKNYTRFLESIGFNEIDHSGDLTETITKPNADTPKYCLDIRNIKQPFFSYKRYDLQKKKEEFEKIASSYSVQEYPYIGSCVYMNDIPNHTDPPKCIRMVVLTALKDNVVENSRIGGLGAGELQVGASRYAMASSSDFTEFSFASDGLELYNFSEQEMINLNSIKEISKTLPRKDPGAHVPDYAKSFVQYTPEEHGILQHSIDYLSMIVKEWYTKIFKVNVDVIPTRNIVPRAAGCDQTKCVIPGNPMMHLDYFSFSDAYDAQCNVERQNEINADLARFGIPNTIVNDCRNYNKEDMIDLVNIWFPTGPVHDWPLAFMPFIQEQEYIKVQIISGSIASSVPLRKIPAEAKIIYKNNMTWGDAYLFRSASCPEQGKKGILHGSFRISNDDHIRRSFECRFMIFKHKTPKSRL